VRHVAATKPERRTAGSDGAADRMPIQDDMYRIRDALGFRTCRHDGFTEHPARDGAHVENTDAELHAINGQPRGQYINVSPQRPRHWRRDERARRNVVMLDDEEVGRQKPPDPVAHNIKPTRAATSPG
jgi:hypothetical protein